MEPIDEVLEAWFNEWWPEPNTAESNVVKKDTSPDFGNPGDWA